MRAVLALMPEQPMRAVPVVVEEQAEARPVELVALADFQVEVVAVAVLVELPVALEQPVATGALSLSLTSENELGKLNHKPILFRSANARGFGLAANHHRRV
jgi:hypothetical protein